MVARNRIKPEDYSLFAVLSWNASRLSRRIVSLDLGDGFAVTLKALRIEPLSDAAEDELLSRIFLVENLDDRKVMPVNFGSILSGHLKLTDDTGNLIDQVSGIASEFL